MSRRRERAHPCPTPNKDRHGNVDRARLAAISICLRSGDTLYGYRCPAGPHWHVTSRASWDGNQHLLLARSRVPALIRDTALAAH